MATWNGTKTFLVTDKYSFDELNRANGNIQYLSDFLASLGYPVTLAGAMKVNYTRTDFPKVSDINTSRTAINKVVQGFYPVATLITVNAARVQSFGYQDANALEVNAQAVYDAYDRVAKELKYCGAATCGEDNTFL